MYYFENKPNLNGSLWDFLNSLRVYDIYFSETFIDEECSIKECHYARRSFNDILKICKCYFPETTEQDIAKLITDENLFFTRLCGDINKWVFGFNSILISSTHPLYLREGDSDQVDIDGWTLDEIKELAK